MAIAELDPPATPPGATDAAALAVLGDVGAAAADVAARLQQGVVQVHTRAGGGAGTIWRSDGIVVTNHHVVPHDRATVTLADGRTLPATVEARDPYNDLAVLAVDAGDLPALPVGDASALKPGELVLAVGHPFGVRGALTVGVIHRARPPRGFRTAQEAGRERELVQADLLLGPGNSGGPLVDARGRVVGINAMIHDGLALAVPSHLATRLVERPDGPPVIGVAVQHVRLAPAQAAQATRIGFPTETAILVVDVEDESAAAAAGLLAGDLLLALDGHLLDVVEALPDSLAAYRGGETHLTVLRGLQPLDLRVMPRRRK